MTEMICPECGIKNFGYFRDDEKRYRFTECRCPLPTVREIAKALGMCPGGNREREPMCPINSE
jgi:hypothetical protein